MRCLGHHQALSLVKVGAPVSFPLLRCVLSWFLPAGRKPSQLLHGEARGEWEPRRIHVSHSDMALMQLGQDAQTGPVAATMARSLQSTLRVEIVPYLSRWQ